MFDNCHVDIVSNDRDRVTLITVKCDHVSCLLSVCSTEPSITDVRCWSSVCRYSVQLSDISDKELTVSSSLQTSPLVLGLLLVSLLLNMAALPQLVVILRNVLNNKDRSGLYKAMFSLTSINVKLIP